MNSTELIAQAGRRYEEMRGESRGWMHGSWCSGYINGWMDHHGGDYRAGVEAMRELLVRYSETDDDKEWVNYHTARLLEEKP